MIATDGSENAEKAAKVGIDLAKSVGGKVIAVYVMDERLMQPYDVMEDEGKNALKRIQKIGRKKNVVVDEILILGNPIEDLPKIANKVNADIVVLASQSKGKFERIILGSTTKSMLENCNVPLLITPQKY